MLQRLLRQFVLTWRMMGDRRIPLWKKLIPVGALLYILSPIDFIPDVFLGIGQLDDIGMMLAGMRLFEMLVAEDIVRQHRAGRPEPQQVIDLTDQHRETQ